MRPQIISDSTTKFEVKNTGLLSKSGGGTFVMWMMQQQAGYWGASMIRI